MALRLSLQGHAGALGQVFIQPHHAWCSWVMMAAVLPEVTLVRSAGAHSTSGADALPETMMVGWARQLFIVDGDELLFRLGLRSAADITGLY